MTRLGESCQASVSRRVLTAALGLAVILFVPPATPGADGGREEPAVRLRKDRPSVFIAFDRVGHRPPLEEGESSTGVWLRLHNNTAWPLLVECFGVPKALGDVGLYYEVESGPVVQIFPLEEPRITIEGPDLSYVPGIPPKPSEDKPPERKAGEAAPREAEAARVADEPPIGYRAGDVTTVREIPPGSSLLFSVPREHLEKDLRIRIQFNYGWEREPGKGYVASGEPRHFVYFFGSSIPK
jgi:hypothetical protein